MTTAFAHAADGHFLRSLYAQPFGLVLSIATAAAAIVALVQATTGMALASAFATLVRPAMWWTLGALAAASWLWKIALVREWIT